MHDKVLQADTMCYKICRIGKLPGDALSVVSSSIWSLPGLICSTHIHSCHCTADPFPFSWPCESVQFTGHNEVEENMATATLQVCSQHGIPSIELQDIQTTGKQDKAMHCTIKLKVT